jgi:hypothetical protein
MHPGTTFLKPPVFAPTASNNGRIFMQTGRIKYFIACFFAFFAINCNKKICTFHILFRLNIPAERQHFVQHRARPGPACDSWNGSILLFLQLITSVQRSDDSTTVNAGPASPGGWPPRVETGPAKGFNQGDS